MRCCILPEGDFQFETESATEEMSLVIFRHFQRSRVPALSWPRRMRLLKGPQSWMVRKTKLWWHTVSRKMIGQALPNVYSTTGLCPHSWLWPIWWSWWHDPGVWISSQCPPVVFARRSHDPSLQPENMNKWASGVFKQLEGMSSEASG